VRLVVLAAALIAAPLAAQVRPQPGTGDPRIQTVDYDANQVVQIQAAPGYQVTLEFGSDEQIESVAVGDSGAWQVTANHRGGHLFIKPLRDGVSTNMTVVTSSRIYAFELTPLYGAAADMAYTVRFRYPAAASAAPAEPEAVAEGRYRVSGERSLRPSRISDDGRHTYIEWPRDRALPAVYALDDRGQEALVNGMMRDDLYVIDSVVPRLVFRIDRHVARAVRVVPRAR
jgi:type IV secretion system protein VirB9